MNIQKYATAIFVCAIVLLVLLFAISSFFHITEIVIDGYQQVSREEIRGRLGIGASTNILLFNTRAARGRIMENLYIGGVTFERELPGRLVVTVAERRLTAYIEHIPGSFLYLDGFGRVLEIRDYMEQPLPLLEGLRFNHFQLGEILEVPDTAAFNIVVQYAQLLYQHNLIDMVSHIHVADSSNIRILVNNIEFNVGDSVGADEKVRTIAEMLSNMPNPDIMIPGFVDMRTLRTEYIFEILQ